MTKSVKTLRDKLMEKLTLGMSNRGFELQDGERAFQKNNPSGSWSVRFGFIKHKLDFDVIVSVSVRLDKLERLLHEDDKDRAESAYSLGAELGNIFQGKQMRWTVSMADNLDQVSQSILETFDRHGMPYLERYSAMETSLGALSGDDMSAWLHSPIHGDRAKHALGLAFLLNKADVFKKLSEDKMHYLKSRNDPDLSEFLDFKRKLEERLKT
jgi:hypothetical protein